ncbi:MAG: hypothetical protein P4L03_05035 [Terracidiphilus sp.]|nr:hypothetical protein [Terracidiphilus sp.]
MIFNLRFVVPARTFMLVRVVGLVIFFVAFLLPACRDPFGTVYPGWKCAQITLGATVAPDAYTSWDVLAVLSGLINPLAVLALLLSFSKRLYGLKLGFFLATVLFAACTWVFFFRAGVVPLVGHFLWIAGALILVFSSAFFLPERPRA